MRFYTVTRAQRLAWQHDETSHGYELEPSLAEQFEVEDQAFRYFDQMIFAPPCASFGLGANGGEPRLPASTSGSSPPSFARGAAAPGSHARERAAVTSSDSSGGGPALTQPVSPSPQHNGQAGSDAGAVTAPSGRPGVANSLWETWVWAA